jgi:hypothetical protein
MIFEYEVDGKVIREENPERDAIIAFINQMSSVGNSFCILTANDESYVQCAGAKSKLTIEYRKYIGRKFNHYVLGMLKEAVKEVSIRYSGGYIKVNQNEVLTDKDAIAVFEAFLNIECLPENYELRETTPMFIE